MTTKEMALDFDVSGKRLGPFASTYGPDTIISYALEIGAGVEELGLV